MKKSRLSHLLIAFSSILIMLSSFGCAKKMTMDKLPSPQIAFGSGGGFTNLTTEYYLLEDGKIVQKSKDAQAYNIITRIDNNQATQVFAGAKILGLDKLQFNEPGNLYYFIAIRNNEQSENRIVWGSNDALIPTEVKNFYKMLLNLLPKTKEQSIQK